MGCCALSDCLLLPFCCQSDDVGVYNFRGEFCRIEKKGGYCLSNKTSSLSTENRKRKCQNAAFIYLKKNTMIDASSYGGGEGGATAEAASPHMSAVSPPPP